MGKIKIYFLIIIFFSLCFIACKKEEKKETSTRKENITNVRVWTVEKKILKPFVQAIGTLKPYEEVIVSSEIDGLLKKIEVEEASKVNKGMLLAEINETDYSLDEKRAQAALKQAEANLINIKLDYSRKESLYKEKLATKQQFDDVSARLSIAEAEIERAKATLSLSQERLLKTKIYSPLDGVIREKKVTKGGFVRASSPLVVIIQINPIKLLFSVSEKDVGSLKEGQIVQFEVEAFAGKIFTGKLKTIYPSLDERTRTLQAEAVIQNEDGFLKPGFFAKIALFTSSPKEAVVVPITSILYENSSVKVFIVQGNIAKEKFIKIGAKYDDFMEVTSGLAGGEQLIVVGQNYITEGSQINVNR
ncbi:MAG: efflux RND transporter periplasmic adaptor subunit [Desulfobacterales bacterium]|nr:efflux RND transporter periplasmic adaptor subunit [Desulfobacterales bacterium]